MLNYKLIEALAMVVQERGFEKASVKLLVTPSAISQRIKFGINFDSLATWFLDAVDDFLHEHRILLD